MQQRAPTYNQCAATVRSVYEALAAELVEPWGCACCTLDAESVAVLNDKNQFSAICERMGMRVPHSFAITSRKRLLEINERCGPARFLLGAHRLFPGSGHACLRSQRGGPVLKNSCMLS